MNQESNKYSKLWLIVPLLNSQEKELDLFLNNHNYFINYGGNIVLKVDGALKKSTTSKVVVIQQKDSGLCEAWNQAIDYMQELNLDHNSYIAFLGLDDVLCHNFCNSIVGNVDANVDFIYGDIYSRLGERYRKNKPAKQPLLFSNTSEYVFDIFHPGMMNRWSTIASFRFNTKFYLAADLDFYIRVSKSKEISLLYLSTIQSIVGADGISNAVLAKNIYKKEWSIIEEDMNVKIISKSIRMTLLTNMSSAPFLYNGIRKLYWIILGKKNINIKC